MDKHHKHNHNKQHEDNVTHAETTPVEETVSQANTTDAQIAALNETNSQLTKELDDAKNLVNKLTLETSQLKREIEKINEDYITKVTLKAKEAKELVDKKYAELEEKSKAEVERKVDRLIESKFDALLNAIEQLTKVVNAPVASSEVQNYVYGFKMILGMLQNGLAELGIHQIVVNVGEPFDENIMQAFELVEDGAVASQAVAYVISNAYEYKGAIIKHAVVKVQK
ncbi:nucleotide exchange factor GrpE [Ureaplasma ceti]|uniref:Nucleotide exchange factor GrpE n=1 Tax=Ureaplasma ceti TaxID=3119530 RepID=A0ABP9U9N5_9BACT